MDVLTCKYNAKYPTNYIRILTSHSSLDASSTAGTTGTTIPCEQTSSDSDNVTKTPSAKKSLTYNLIADAVEKVSPSVVFIEGEVKKVQTPQQPRSGRHRRRRRDEGSPPSVTIEESKVSGSGFVACEKGIVLTSAHVVSNATKIKVTFPSVQKTYDSYIIDADHETDIAALKIVAESDAVFPAAQLGSSADVRVGEWVAALGSPLGLSNTVTSGIVSTLDRRCSELGLPSDKDVRYIQTDTAINVGNSGGPLINLDGDVIGINCITIQPASGISFAVPSDVVKTFLAEAKVIEASFNRGGEATSKYPKKERFFIGVSMLPVTPELIAQLKSRTKNGEEVYGSVEHGVLVAAINPGSPADCCGLAVRDVIVAVNDILIKKPSDLFAEVQKGELMVLKVQRGLKSLVLYVQPAAVSKL